MLLTAEEVAAHLRISLRMVYALAKDGTLQGVRIGRAVRFTPEEVERYIEACQSTTTKRRRAGAGSSKPLSTASGIDLAKAFRAAGVKLKQSDTTNRKRREPTLVLLSGGA